MFLAFSFAARERLQACPRRRHCIYRLIWRPADANLSRSGSAEYAHAGQPLSHILLHLHTSVLWPYKSSDLAPEKEVH